MSISKSDKANFATLQRAWEAGRVAIVESRDLATGEYRCLICAMGSKGEDILPTPLAVMVWNNPFEAFADPTADTLPPAKEPT